MATPKPAPGSVLAYAASAAEATSSFLSKDEAAAPADLAADPSWRFYMPMQAEAGAAFLGEAGVHFPGLPFTATGLAAAHRRLGQVQSGKAALLAQVDRLSVAETLHKNRITEWVGQLSQAVTAKRIDPTTPPAVKEAVALASAPFTSIGTHYQDAQTGLRKNTLELKQQLTEAQTGEAHKDLVIRSLQGERLTAAELQPPAPRKGARKGRR